MDWMLMLKMVGFLDEFILKMYVLLIDKYGSFSIFRKWIEKEN